MTNFLTWHRINHPNIYALMVSVLLSLWYTGLTGIFNYYFPNRGPALSLIFLMIPLIIFLGDDNKLDELHKIGDINPSSNVAAITAAAGNPSTSSFTSVPKSKEQYQNK